MRSNSIEGVKDFFKYQAGMLWLAYAVGGELVARYGPSIKSGLMTAANKLGQAGKYIWDKAGSAAIGAGEWLSKMSKKPEIGLQEWQRQLGFGSLDHNLNLKKH